MYVIIYTKAPTLQQKAGRYTPVRLFYMYEKLNDKQIIKLINNRWNDSESVWEVISKLYDTNKGIYSNEPKWLKNVPVKKSKVRANRIFRDTESVINSLIANPAKPNVLQGRDTPQSKELALRLEKYFSERYDTLNVKEEFRKGLRNLYFSRLMVLKPYWNNKTNDFDVKSIDPRKIRVHKNATNTDDSEFAIEEVTDNILSVISRFKDKKEIILKKAGLSEEEALIQNPEIVYKEAWIGNYVFFVYQGILIGRIRNPYWDWDGILMNDEEYDLLETNQKQALQTAKDNQESRIAELPEGVTYQSYYYNHFDEVRKPYIIATILNNEDSPIGQTDFISQAAPLQENVDKRKRQIDENADIMNGVVKVDEKVMSKADAQRLRFETGGVFWGKGVVEGVQRETGTALPQFIFDDMLDSRNEIDNIMASTSAFRGEREGQETKAGRLALIQQSYLNLNELVQVVDYVSRELFNWFYQLAKVRYTEHHYAKTIGADNAVEVISIMQDDLEDGTEIRIIPGKTLPEDMQWKFEMAQKDMELGVLSPVDYFKLAGYDSPNELVKNKLEYDNGVTAQNILGTVPQAVEQPINPQGIGNLSALSNTDQVALPQS